MATTEQLNAALDGRYAIDRLVGEGGMATVYLARDVRHNRRVALKVLKPDLGAVVGVERFLSEIQVTANLQHPNLLPLFDSGAADHLLYYVMPYIEGESLRARLDREKQLPVEEAVRIATAVGSALDYAHRHGVIHRDLKPENILLHEGQPLVADFGIALAVSNAGGNRITQTGLSLGTPQYMSPEQATGDRAIDGRTDIYSLGALTYEMLCGEAPHTGSTSQAIIARLLTERPRSLRSSRPSVPEQVEAAVERALEKLPADRWATAKEFAEALSGARVVTRSTYATTSGAAQAPARRPATRELAAWGVAAAAIGVSGYLALRPEPPSAPLVPTEFEVTLPDTSLSFTGGGGANSVAISQDGSTIVFVATHSGRRSLGMLYARHLDDRNVIPIPGSDSTGSPTLSPDGSEVLFPVRSGVSTGPAWPTKLVPLRGGRPREVIDSTPANGQTSWSDAGQLVVGSGDRLWTVPAGGGARTLLAAPDTARRHYRYGFPHALPGGKAALITIWLGMRVIDSTMLGVVTIPDGKVTELGLRGTYPQYSGTGHIVYATTDARLFAVPFSLRSHKVTGAPFPIVDGVSVGTGGAAGFAVARNGTLAYRTGALASGNQQLYIVSRDGIERPVGIPPGRYESPRISPDGRQVVFASPASSALNVQASMPDIWRFDTTAKVATRLTADSSSLYPSWSNDGERVIFTRPGMDSVVMSMPLYSSGGATAMFHTGAIVRAFSASRTGRYGAVRVGASTDPPFDIWLVHLDSLANPRPFLTEAYDETAPEVSPDGQLIAYVTNRTGQYEVYVRRIPSGAEETRVSINGGREPIWGANSRELYFRPGTQSPEYVMSATLSTNSRLTVTRRDTLFANRWTGNPNRSNYDVFPDGSAFVMIRAGGTAVGDVTTRLIVLQNWHLRTGARGQSER